MVKLNIDLKNILLDFEFLNSVATNVEYNDHILGYYAALLQEISEKRPVFNLLGSTHSFTGLKPENEWNGVGHGLEKLHGTLYKKLERMCSCNDKWVMDVYEEAKVKDFQRTNLCKDKFCNNCKKVKQASRMARYIPEIEKYTDFKKIHLVLTSPNVVGHELKETIRSQFDSFKRLILYLDGRKRIKGLDIHNWAYQGAVRSLEVTYRGDSYHPHIHAMLMFDVGFQIGEKDQRNAFSIRNGRVKRRFAEREIIIQKIWYLLMNKQKVTLAAIEEVDLGYSCMMDEFQDGDYHELFKYMTKGNGTGDVNDIDAFMTFENFKVLYFSLLGLHQIQGYGCLYHIEDIEVDEDMDKVYEDFIEALKQKEKSRVAVQSPRDLIADISKYRIISRKKYVAYLRELYQEEAAAATVKIVDQIEIPVE